MENKAIEPSFEILMNWAAPFSPCLTEEDMTLGDMSIKINGQCFTRNVSTVINSLRETIRVSSYPLALWFIEYWWRILYEPIPSGEQIEMSYNWKNSHNLASANCGYIWPDIKFIPDGQFITIISTPQYDNSRMPFFYLGMDEAAVVDNETFCNAITKFIFSTINRLDEKGDKSTELHSLFAQLENEIKDEDFALYRRIEAILGYDPDQAPDVVIQKMEKALKKFSVDNLAEIASACSTNETSNTIKDIESAISMTTTGIKGKWNSPISDIKINNRLPAWDAGRLIARRLRAALGNTNKKIETRTLCEFFEIPTKELSIRQPSHDRFSISHVTNENLYINFKNESSQFYTVGRRFQLSRLIGSILAKQCEKIFISSDSKTYSQKLQRAFAAEFLAPIDEVKNFVEPNVTNETVKKAATHFSVSPRTIAHSLTNNGVISKFKLNDLSF